jgi:hypothetical protein
MVGSDASRWSVISPAPLGAGRCFAVLRDCAWRAVQRRWRVLPQRPLALARTRSTTLSTCSRRARQSTARFVCLQAPASESVERKGKERRRRLCRANASIWERQSTERVGLHFFGAHIPLVSYLSLGSPSVFFASSVSRVHSI